MLCDGVDYFNSIYIDCIIISTTQSAYVSLVKFDKRFEIISFGVHNLKLKPKSEKHSRSDNSIEELYSVTKAIELAAQFCFIFVECCPAGRDAISQFCELAVLEAQFSTK